MSEYNPTDEYIPQSEQEQYEQEQNKKYEAFEAEKAANDPNKSLGPDAAATPQPAKPPKSEDKGLVHGLGHGAAAIPLGTADFITDTAALVPWLKPVDEWWDENSPRSNHPVHKIIRDLSLIHI